MEGLPRGQLGFTYSSPSQAGTRIGTGTGRGPRAQVTWTVWRLYTFTTWNRKL